MLLPYAFFSQHKTKQKKILASFIVPDLCLDLFIFYVYVILIEMEIKKNFSSFLNHVFKISNKKQKNPFNPYLPRSLIGLISLEFLYAL